MKLGRRLTQFFSFVLDELLPPILRDRYWFMWPLQWLLFRGRTRHFMDFKEKAPYLGPEGIRKTYEMTAHVHLQRETDLNPACLAAVENAIEGDQVLEVGCGRGYLAKRLAERYRVTGVDFNLDPKFTLNTRGVVLIRADIEKLPFRENSFDTVICTHTLEHLVNLPAAMSQLRQIACRRLIVVVPLQRPYRYSFDLHLQFFPYPHSFLIQAGIGKGKVFATRIGGDLFYVEDLP